MNSFIKMIIKRIVLIGHVPLCNGIASRAPHLFGICFPLCYRCTFFIIGFFLTLFILYKKKSSMNLYFACVCLIPLIIDGCLQTFWGIESTNLRRAITGCLFGFGMGMIVIRLNHIIDHF